MLDQLWYGKSRLRWLLWPFSLIYRLVVAIKAAAYHRGIAKIISFDVPVIVVGNITVGGTGKTPLCIALCDLLKQQGFRPGLVSRGYGGKASTWPQVVTPDSDPILVGDEPVLLVRRSGCPMVVGPDRVAAVQRLLADYKCDVVISDDGLQHYRMGRQVEIIVLDKARGLGNGLCLPAGPLRESSIRLETVNHVIINGTDMHIRAGKITALNDKHNVLTAEAMAGKQVCAVAGIGNPQRFFDSLKSLNLDFTTTVFSDHHAFKPEDLSDISADIIIMTEKDAVKCRAFADSRCYVLPISAELSAATAARLLTDVT